MYLLAPTALSVSPADMAAQVRAHFGDELRRAGGFAQLSLLGAQACLDAAGYDGPIAMLWASERGAILETNIALNDDLAGGEPVMPFDFIATQPHLAGVLLAQRGRTITQTMHLHLTSAEWPWLLDIADGWLKKGGRVLLGWVEESRAPDHAHCSNWCLMSSTNVPDAIRCEKMRAPAEAVQATGEDWLSHVATWHRSRRSAPQIPLALRGASRAWRFCA